MKRRFFILALFPLLLALQACDIMPIGGTGGEGLSLTGTLVDERGVRVAGAKVSVHPEPVAALAKTLMPPRPDSTLTDAEGRFEFPDLPAGVYGLSASFGLGDTIRALFLSGIDLRKSLDLGVDTLRVAGGLRVVVRTLENAPVVGASCALRGTPWSATSDISGACIFSAVAPGAYRLMVASLGLIATEVDLVALSGEIVEADTVLLHSEGVDVAWTVRYQATWTYFNSVAWSGNLLVAVGFRTAVFPEPTIGFIITSPDGINWTQRTSGIEQSLSDVVWAGNQFLALAARGRVLLSPDGIEWTPHKLPDTTALLDAVAWSGTNFVIVGSGITLTSPDGVNWTAQEQEPGFTRVAWAGSQFVAADNSSSIATSPDGAVWTAREVRAGSHIHGVAWGNGLLVAVGTPGLLADGPGILTSTDGISWVQRAPALVGGGRVEWVNGRFIVDGRLWSEDGVVWQEESHSWQYWGRVWTGTRMISISNEGIFTAP